MRAIVIVLDGVGIGNAPDAEKYGDLGAATLQHIAEKMGGIFLKNLWKLGLTNIFPIEGMSPNKNPIGAYGNMIEKSAGKDSTSGHWELAGLIVKKPFPTYPDGFPEEIISEFERRIGRKVLWNKPASGTEIINRLGDEHLKTGYPIVYTSADSVFQIAAHENIVPLDKLYEWCRIAREILSGDNGVARVIARPFIGSPGNFTRTANRHDFSLPPFDRTMLDMAKEAGMSVVAIGKIYDLYAGSGITEKYLTSSNSEGIDVLISGIEVETNGIIMVNLVDFDMLYGHRRNVVGFANALKEFDNRLPEIIKTMKSDDLLFITADHGNDPTHKGTDHTRERVPLLIYGQNIRDINIGDRDTFADLGATVCEYLNIESTKDGKSFLNVLIK
ncbi:phosphopentomutase [bacterium]|nr:phosphopentomutase [bacterium]